MDPLDIINARIARVERDMQRSCCPQGRQKLPVAKTRLEMLRRLHTSKDEERIGATLARYLGELKR